MEITKVKLYVHFYKELGGQTHVVSYTIPSHPCTGVTEGIQSTAVSFWRCYSPHTFIMATQQYSDCNMSFPSSGQRIMWRL